MDLLKEKTSEELAKIVQELKVGKSVTSIKQSIENHLKYTLARDEETARMRDWWMSLCYGIRDRVMDRFMETQKLHDEKNVKRVYYFSMEFLMGRLLKNNLLNLEIWDPVEEAVRALGLDFERLREEEMDMGLGNGGLGRLAACFLDSLATLNYPAIGYGIHYEFGLFRQEFVNGKQVEHPDSWMKSGVPWQIERPEYNQRIKLYGQVKEVFNDQGDCVPVWVDTKELVGMPWDIAIVGYEEKTVNFLRLWSSKASEDFDLKVFNEGGYVEAVHEKVVGETASKVLYPNDDTDAGKELRLVQQYFFVSCSLRDIIRRYRSGNQGWDNFTEKVVIQLNDTHPSISIVELMRILIDEEKMDWGKAWDITRKVFAYTNHTLMPEALEMWSVPLMQKVLPRHLQIIYQINGWFLDEQVAKRWPGDGARRERMSIIKEGQPPYVRMSYLAVIGSFSTNGVAALHTELVKKDLFNDFYELYPERFNNKTNGITPRRWLKLCNPLLSKLITNKIGSGWVTDLDKLRGLENFAKDEDFQREYMEVKLENKKRLANIILDECQLVVDPNAMFDVQVKRLHEYKRQHLNLLHIMTLYHRMLHNRDHEASSRVFIFGAKAAPGYWMAKKIIHAINAVAFKINNDKRINGRIKVAFIPNYSVTLAGKIIPAADLSEQISTAGKEASGTGNMKLSLNGALTIGTLDGANVEIREEVGDENIFIFGNTVDEVKKIKMDGYRPMDYYEKDDELRTVLGWLKSDSFCPNEPGAFEPLVNDLLYKDNFMVLADYRSYCDTQDKIGELYKNKSKWAEMAILNTARMGKFSSDRSIYQYATDIWKIKPAIE